MEIPQVNRWQGLGLRVAGIIPLLLVVILCVMAGGFWFYVLVLIAAFIMIKEWEVLVAKGATTFKIPGYILTVLPCVCLLWLRSLADGEVLVFSLIAIIAATDIGAYFAGKRFGHYKLAPVLSPNKTWEGLEGGAFAAMIIAAITLPVSMALFTRFFAGFLLALLAQMGDIFESIAKRRAGVKDSGTIIPGHGGLLDRVDGYLFATPAFALIVYVVKAHVS